MIFSNEVEVPAGFEAAAEGQLDSRRPLYVGRRTQVHLVSFAPTFLSVEVAAVCREGVHVNLAAEVRLEIERGNLPELLRDAGYSTVRDPARISADDVCRRNNLEQAIKAAVQTHVRTCGFFELDDHSRVTAGLNRKIEQECSRARIAGELISVDITPILPDPDALADLRSRVTANAALAPIVEHFRETLRQREVLQAEVELAKVEGERARTEAQQQLTITRADSKIVELQEEERVKARQAELQEKEAERQREAHKRNASIKEMSAGYEFAYKQKRLEDEMKLAQKEVELAKQREAQAAAEREQRRLDQELETERERDLSRLRAEERATTFAELSKLFEKCRDLPIQSYEGVQVVVGGGEDLRSHLGGLLVSVLAKLAAEPLTPLPKPVPAPGAIASRVKP